MILYQSRPRLSKRLFSDDERQHPRHQVGFWQPNIHFTPNNPHKHLKMSSTKSAALKAPRTIIAGQRRSRNIPAKFQNSLLKAQHYRRTPRLAIKLVR
jgi:hypothetical protein